MKVKNQQESFFGPPKQFKAPPFFASALNPGVKMWNRVQHSWYRRAKMPLNFWSIATHVWICAEAVLHIHWSEQMHWKSSGEILFCYAKVSYVELWCETTMMLTLYSLILFYSVLHIRMCWTCRRMMWKWSSFVSHGQSHMVSTVCQHSKASFCLMSIQNVIFQLSNFGKYQKWYGRDTQTVKTMEMQKCIYLNLQCRGRKKQHYAS